MTPETLTTQYYEYKRSQCHSARSAYTRASDLGHPCIAYLCWTRLAGEKAETPDKVLACIFAEGRVQEQAVISDLLSLGYEIQQAQRAVYWEKFEISGHIDGWLYKQGEKAVLIEIKSVSPHAFSKFQTVEDIKAAKQYFYVKWISQLQVYMLMESVETSWLILKNKATGELRVIEVPLDYELAESLIKKAEQVKALVSITEPNLGPVKANNIDLCEGCQFRTICMPSIDAGAGAKAFNDPEMEAALDRRAEVQANAKEYSDLDDEIKEKAKRAFEAGDMMLICGKWLIRGVEGKRGEKKTWTTKITKI